MNFIQHPSNNSVYDPPPGLTNEECRPLPVTKIQYPNGFPAIVSFWVPTPEELDLLIEGKPVILCVLGTELPPVSISVGELK